VTNPTTLAGPAAHGIGPDEADAIITEMLRSGVVKGFIVHLAARFGPADRGSLATVSSSATSSTTVILA
jgi:hypothetical protein